MTRFRSLAFATIVAALVAASPASAASSEDKPLNLDVPAQAEAASRGGGGGSILRTLFGLAIVVGVIFALHWILRQVKEGRGGRAGGTGLTTVATLPLGAGRALHLVRVGAELVLVGSSEHGVTSIRSYREEEAHALGMLDDPVVDGEPAGPGQSAGARFLEALRQMTVRK